MGLMRAELDEGKRERDRLLGFEKEVMRKRTEESVGREGLAREIAKVCYCGLIDVGGADQAAIVEKGGEVGSGGDE